MTRMSDNCQPFHMRVFFLLISFMETTPIAFRLFDNNRDWWILRTIIIEPENFIRGEILIKPKNKKKFKKKNRNNDEKLSINY